MNKKAFTLIELLIVVALIGILSSIGVITFQGQIKASKQPKFKAGKVLKDAVNY